MHVLRTIFYFICKANANNYILMIDIIIDIIKLAWNKRTTYSTEIKLKFGLVSVDRSPYTETIVKKPEFFVDYPNHHVFADLCKEKIVKKN